MRFLIVGASGFIGRHLLAHVKSLGFEAIGTHEDASKPGLIMFDLLRHRIGDCVDRSFFDREGRVHVVICAVIGNMDRCLAERELSYKVNVENTIRLIDDVCALKARPVFFSTGFVFDGQTGHYTEDHPQSPANEYGRQKAEVERHLRQNVSAAFVARLDKVVGDSLQEHHLFTEWHQLITAGQAIACIEGTLLSPTHVDDVAHAVFLACQSELKGVFHIANSEFYSRDELARQFCHALGKPPNVVCKPLQDFNFLDNRALKSCLNGFKFVRATGMSFTSVREMFAKFAVGLASRSGGTNSPSPCQLS